MKDNRVLARIQARTLTDEEIQSVTGGIHTLTKCTAVAAQFLDGDHGEC